MIPSQQSSQHSKDPAIGASSSSQQPARSIFLNSSFLNHNNNIDQKPSAVWAGLRRFSDSWRNTLSRSGRKSKRGSPLSSTFADDHNVPSSSLFFDESSPLQHNHQNHKAGLLLVHEEDTAATAPCRVKKMSLSERDVYDFVWAYMDEFTRVAKYCQGTGSSKEAWEDFWRNRHTPDYLLVRPSGNTMNAEGLKTMFESKSVAEFSDEVLAVEDIKLLGPTTAVTVFRSEQDFCYLGGNHEEGCCYCTWTAVVVLHEGRLKITSMHRSGKKVDAVYL